MFKKIIRSISTILVLVLLVNMIPAQALGNFNEENAGQIQETDQVITLPGNAEQVALDDPVTILGEIPSGRTEYSKEFLLSNGLHMMSVYAEPVHYLEDGQWNEINNTLRAVNGTYQNTAGVWEVSFPQQVGNSQSISITKDGYTLSFGMPERLTLDSNVAIRSADTQTYRISQSEVSTATVTASLDVTAEKAEAEFPETVLDGLASRMTYQNIHSGTDVIYDLTSNKVKESVVLKSYDSTLRGFRYTLNVGAMQPKLIDDGAIEFYDETGSELIMVMPAPYLLDDAMDITTDVQVSLTGKDGTYILTYTLPQGWLAAQERQWPVILDPVIQADLQTTNIRDTIVGSTYTYNHLAGYLDVGYEPKPGIKRSFVKYTTLPTLNSSDVIVSATMTMWQMYGRSSAIPVEVHKVKGVWESQTLQWTNMPDYDETVEDFVMAQSVQGYTWDVTDIVQEWYRTGMNTGMMFKATDEVENAGIENFRQFFSSDYGTSYKPELKIIFRSSNGLESYWDYTSASAGRAGNAYINNYCGNLVFTRELMGFDGNRAPVSIYLTYNANDVSKGSQYGFGNGWRSNYNQRVYRWSQNSNYYIWEDEDGTQHYFKYESYGTYEDEDGLELTLTTTGNTNAEKFAILDKNGNARYFDNYGRLRSIVNNQQSKSTITITYKTNTSGSKLLNTITDGAGRVYQLYYYNLMAEELLFQGTTSETIARVAFTFDSAKNLTSVMDMDGEQTHYTYHDGSMLASVTDIDGYRLEYTYSVEAGLFAPCRVKSIREYHNGAEGGHMTIEYGNNQTVFTDEVNHTTLITQFNDFGNTVSVQDDEGRAQYAQFARNDANDTAGKGNQLTLSSKMQNTVINLLSDSSFEDGTPWNNATIEATGYRGGNALSLAGNSSAQSTAITAKAGATYTFSGYVKTDSGKIMLGITDGISTVYSDAISAPNWTRIQVSYTNSTSSDQTIYGVFSAENGTSYLDCVQFEEAPTASRYNLVQNGDMNSTAYWIATNTGSEDTVSPAPTASPVLSQSAYKITGDYLSAKSVKQTISVSGSQGDSFVFGGWAMGQSASLASYEEDHLKDFALKCTLYNGTEVVKEESVQFNADVNQWQFIYGAIAATGDYTSLTIELIYSNNANTVYFDGIQVFQEEFGVSYTYDDDGNVISTVDLQKKETTYEYDSNNNLTEIIQDGKTKMEYTYDNFHNVLTATTEEGLCYTFAYDTYGNNTSVSITEGGKTISSSAAYTADGNLLASTTNALGHTTTYSYDEDTGLLEWVQLPEDTEATRTNYEYDEMYRVASIAADITTDISLFAEYTYEDDLLTAIQTPTTTYTFEHGNFSLRSKVTVGTYTLASYTYDDPTNRLIRLDYGNGDSVQYTYDDYGRLILETYEDGQTVSYAYDNSGNLATVTDSETGCVTTYYYDLLDRLVGYREKSATLDHSVTYTYDAENNLSSMVETVNGVSKTYSYTYDTDNRLISMSVGDTTVSYTYDDFGRVSKRTTKHGETVMESITPGYYETENTTSSQIVSYNGYTYTYDGNGNITYYGDGRRDENFFQYDSQNQMIRAESYDLGYIWLWEYDNAGNILSRTKYDFFDTGLVTPLETVSYEYNDSEWGDLLTSYDGRTITYDVIGNPLSDGQWTYTWQHGRQLATMSNEDTTWNFTYNADGMRTSRTDGTTTYTYVYNGSQLSQMTVDGQIYEFTYDATGTPLTVIVDGNTYYYSTNLQGDVIAVKNQNGIYVAAYTYDPWGNVICNNIRPDVMHNPLLYRGYVYDLETELYYLQSRYYNPEIGRFINADIYASTGQGLLGNNMFAYCQNKPIIYTDYNGYFLFTLIGTVVGALSAAATAAIEGKTGEEFWGEVANGAVSGAVTGAATDVLVATGGGAAVVCCVMAGASAAGSLIGNYVEETITGEDKTIKEYTDDALWAGASGALFAYMHGPIDSSMIKIGKNGYAKYLINSIRKDGLTSIAEEVLTTMTSDIGRFTIESIGRLVMSIFN